MSIQLSHTPLIKHLREKFFAVKLIAEIRFLNFHLKGLESALMPLFDCNALSELSEPFNSFHKLLQSIMTF